MSEQERSGVFIDFEKVENDSDAEIREFLAKRKAQPDAESKPDGTELKLSGERTPYKSTLKVETENKDFADLKRKVEALVAKMNKTGYQKNKIPEYHADLAQLDQYDKQVSHFVFAGEEGAEELKQSISDVRGKYGARKRKDEKPAAPEAENKSAEKQEMEKLRSSAMKLVQEIEQLVEQEKLSEVDSKITRAIEMRDELGKFKNVEGYDEADEDLKFSLEMIAGKLEKLRKKEKKETKPEQGKETEQQKMEKAAGDIKATADRIEAALDRGDLKTAKATEIPEELSKEFDKYQGVKGYAAKARELSAQIDRIHEKVSALEKSTQATSEDRGSSSAPGDFDREKHNREVRELLEKASKEKFVFFASKDMLRLAKEHGIEGAESMTPQEILAELGKPIADTSDEKFHQARDRYEKAKEEYKKATGVRGLLKFVGKETKEKASDAYERAKFAYEKERAEYAMSSAERAVAAKTRDAEARFRERMPGTKSEKFWDKFKRGWKAVADFSLYDVVKKARDGKEVENKFGRFLLKAVNVKNVAAFGLLGYAYGGYSLSAFASGKVATGTTALTAWYTRRALGGVGGMVAFSDLYRKKAASRHEQSAIDSQYLKLGNADDWKNMRLDHLANTVADYEIQAALNGKNLAEDPQYKELIRILTERAAQEKENKLAELLHLIDSKVDKRVKQVDKRAKIAGALGLLLGSGLAQKGMGWLFSEHTAQAAGYPEAQAPAGIMPEKFAAPDVPDLSKMDSLQVGSRGIEGALLDYKGQNADKMWEWLQSQEYNQGVTDKGALVHRYMEHYAQERGYTIDVGDKDLSWIDKNVSLQIGANGQPELVVNDSNFLPKSAPEVAVPAATTPESIPVNSDPNTVYETIRQTPSVELSEPPPPLSTEQQVVADSVQRQASLNQEVAQTETTFTEAKSAADESWLEVLRTNNTSEGVRSLLGDESGFFSKNILDVSEGDINGLREMSRAQFERNLAEPSFREKYEGLARALLHPELTKDIGADSKSMHEVILKMATNYKNR